MTSKKTYCAIVPTNNLSYCSRISKTYVTTYYPHILEQCFLIHLLGLGFILTHIFTYRLFVYTRSLDLRQCTNTIV